MALEMVSKSASKQRHHPVTVGVVLRKVRRGNGPRGGLTSESRSESEYEEFQTSNDRAEAGDDEARVTKKYEPALCDYCTRYLSKLVNSP